MKLKINTLIFALCASTCLLVAAVGPNSFRGLQEVNDGSQDASVTIDTTDQGATNNNPVVVTQDSETSADNTSPIPVPEPAINISPIPIPEPAVPVEPVIPADPSGVNPETEVEVPVPDAPDANNTVAPAPSNNITITGLGALIQALNNASNATNATIDAVTISQLAATTSDAGVQYSGVVTVSNDQGESIEGLVSGVSDQTDGTLALNITAYLAPVVNNTDADGFTEIDAETVAQNATVNGALSFGLASIVDRGIGQRKIPPAEPSYNITAFYGAQYKDFEGFTRFKFQISATNALNYRINTNITIDYNLARQTYRLNGYWYHSWNYPLSAFPPLPPVDNSTNTTNSTEPVNNGTTVDNSTIPTPTDNQPDNSTVIDSGNNSTNSTDANAGNNTTEVPPVPVSTLTADNYTIVDVNTVAQNETLQNVLNWGVNAIVQKGISQYKVPPASPEYNITALYDAQYRVARTGVWYRFNFRARNSLNYWLDANITVFQRNSNQSLSLNGYWYNSWNYPRSAIPTPPATNTTANTTTTTTPTTATNTTNTSTAPATTPATTTTSTDTASASTPGATPNPTPSTPATQPVPGDVNFPTEPVFVNPNVDASAAN